MVITLDVDKGLHISAVAAQMCETARANECAVAAEYNGLTLMAIPSTTAFDIVTEYHERHSARCEQRQREFAEQSMQCLRDWTLSPAFLDLLIKRSVEAELILQDSGRIRLQRAALAAIELYLEQFPPSGNQEVK